MIKYPSYQEIINRIRADVAANLPGTDPTIFGSYLRGLADSLGGRSYDIVLLAKQLATELFPQTSSGEYLERWAGYEGLTRNSATVAAGPVTFSGPAGTAITAGTQFRADNSEIYATLVGITLATNSQDLATLSRVASIATATTGSEHHLATGMSVTISGAQQIIAGIVRVGSTATATTSGDHYLTSGDSVTITGADQAEYNGTFTVTVTAADTFDYTVAGTPDTPATGAIFRGVPGYNGTFQITATDATSFTYELSSTPPLIANNASVAWDGNFANLESVNTGINTNLEPGAQLLPVTPIGGVDVRAYVQPGGVSGGTDDETDESLRIRTLQSRSNPVANFNVTAIEKEVLSVPGVTRVLVKRIYPAVGSVTILFLRDNDVNPIPDATEIQQVKDVIYPIVPAHSSLDDVYIQGPTPVIQNFRFFEIDPDTPSMREAITQNLIAFFQDEVEFETTVTDDKYGAAIINTIDPLNGDALVSFLLSEPLGDIVVGDEEIAILGTVTFE
jgi:uncharacterized phage protein gp47/JayE